MPEHFARWFAPRGVEVHSCEMDARPGGALRFQHRFPTGEGVSIKGVFDEVVAPSRLRFTFTFVDADDRPTAPPQLPDWPIGVHIVLTVELHATRRGTHLRLAEPGCEDWLTGSPCSTGHSTSLVRTGAALWSARASRFRNRVWC